MSPDPRARPSHDTWDLPEGAARAIGSEVIPRMLLSHRAGPLPPEFLFEAPDRIGPEQVDDFVELLRTALDGRTDGFVDDLISGGASAEAVYLDLLAPAARQLGDLWATDECSFVEVSVCLGRMQRVLRTLSRLFLSDAEHEDSPGRVLLACVPGEQHTLGLYMVAEFFVRSGWAVNVGPPLIEDDLLMLVRDQWFDVIGFSVACDSQLKDLSREIRKIRRVSQNGSVSVLVGGRVFVEQPELVGRVGADAMAATADAAPRVAAGLICQRLDG